MKTIEEMAYCYAKDRLIPNAQYDNAGDVHSMRCLLADFAKKVLEERGRWHNPQEVLPKDEERVIVKAALRNGAILVTGGWYTINEFPTGWSVDLERTFGKMKVIGWRPICD